ncbi:MAG: AAA family ATPase [Saprospiraceae bacterium]
MHRLEIRNFGPISEADIEVGDLTVIIGEQATGKSTIAKLIYFFQSLKEDALKAALHGVDTNGNPSSIFRREATEKFRYFFKPSYFQSNTQIKYSFSKSQKFEVEIREGVEVEVAASPNYWAEIDYALFRIQVLLENRLQELLQKQTSKSILNPVQSPHAEIKNILDGLFPECQDALYIPAGRNISVGYSEQFEQYFRDRLILGLSSGADLIQTDANRSPTADMFLLENFMKRVAEIKDEFRSSGGGFSEMVKDYAKRFADGNGRVAAALRAINQHISEILRGEYRADGSAERIQFSKDKFIWLREASSGQQESIRILQDMMLLTRDGTSVFRAIEEPEAHLFPLAQQHLVEIIALAQAATGSRFVLTTHSPYIVSALNNILFYSQLTQNGVQNDSPKLNPENLRGYMLTRDADTGAFKCESLLKDVGRAGQPLKLMGHTSLDTVAEQMGATFSELRTRYRNQTLEQTPTEAR